MVNDARLLHLAWLARLRWGALACQGALVVAAEVIGDLDVPLLGAALLIGIGLASNAAVHVARARHRSLPEPVVGAIFGLDIATLTLLLHLTGGPLNPFSFLYLVHVALATVALSPRWAWGVALASVAAYGALFSAPIDAHRHHHGMELHLRGMWLAFAITALFMVYFVGSLRRSLDAHERALAEAHRLEARSQRLVGLATLAGGTAHELSTPLATISLVAFELERKLRAMSAPADLVEDARLALDQVERCRHILAQMSADAGETLGERQVPVAIREVIDEALAPLEQRERVEVRAPGDADRAPVQVPKRAMAQAIRGLAKNAIEASRAPVELAIAREGREVSVVIRDHGDGMSGDVLSRVGEPFFTTKPVGRGMGLGVFLARSLAERFGGRLSIESEPGRGSRVELRLPLATGGAA